MGESQRIRGHLFTVIFAGAVALTVMLTLFKMSGALSLGGTYNVRVLVPQAGSLTQGTSVTMAGARVGTVTGVDRRGVGALVKVRIDDKSVTPLPKDSHASLAVRTVLGENYIEIEPGSSKENLEKNGIVTAQPGNEYVDLDQIISTLQGKTRQQARNMVQGLDEAVGDRGNQLNSTLHGASSLLVSGSDITETLVADRQRIAKLVKQLGDVTSAVGQRGASIETLAKQGKVTFTALTNRDDKLRDLLDVLPSTLKQVKQTTDTVGNVSRTAAPVLSKLAVAVNDAQPTVSRLQPAAAEGRAVVRQLNTAAAPLQTTLTKVRTLSGPTTKTLPAVSKVFCQLNPMLEYAEPYKADIMSLVEGFGAATNSYDAIGHTIRLLPVESDSAAVGLPTAINQAAYTALHTGFFGKILNLNFAPYPKPGEANQSSESYAQRKGPQDYAANGGKYPRVEKQC